MGLTTNKWTFNRMVETDGVAMCAHFLRPKTDAELESVATKKENRARTRLEAATRKAERERSPERVKRERNAKRVKTIAEKKAAKKLSAATPLPPPAASRPQHRHGDVGIDPGVSPNVAYAVHILHGKVKRRRFTIGRYYHDSGVKKLQAQTQVWLRGVQAAQSTVDDISIKTSEHASVRAHIRRYALVHRELWDEKTKARWARGRLGTYIRKPAALDAFYRQLKADGPVHRNFYGDGNMSTNLRGCKPAPNTLCLRRAKIAFKETVLVDEFLTTQCCWACLARTQPVSSGDKVVRGLVYCSSNTCGCLTNRDFQGGMNVVACGAGPRPPQLSRSPVIGVRRRTRHVIETPKRKDSSKYENVWLPHRRLIPRCCLVGHTTAGTYPRERMTPPFQGTNACHGDPLG